MKKKYLQIVISFFCFTYISGQNNQDVYKIKIGNYVFITQDRPYFETEKTFTINIKTPRFIRKVSTFDPDGNEHHSTDTTDHFLLTKLMDSIPLKSVSKFINTEVELFRNDEKLKIGKITVEVFQANGEFQGFSNRIE